jgi:hypothetical protein
MYIYVYILSVGRTPARYPPACIAQIFFGGKPFDLSFWNYTQFFSFGNVLFNGFDRIYSTKCGFRLN